MTGNFYRKTIFESIAKRLHQLLIDGELCFIFYKRNGHNTEQILSEYLDNFEYHINLDIRDIEILEDKITEINSDYRLNILFKSNNINEIESVKAKFAETDFVYKNRLFIFTQSLEFKDLESNYFNLDAVNKSIFENNWNHYVEELFWSKDSEKWDKNGLNLDGTHKEFYNKLTLLPKFFNYNDKYLDGIISLLSINFTYSTTKSHLKLREYFLLTISAFIECSKSFFNETYLSLEQVDRKIIVNILAGKNKVKELAISANVSERSIKGRRKIMMEKGLLVKNKTNFYIRDSVFNIVLREIILNEPILNQIEEKIRFNKIKLNPKKDYSEVLNISYLESYIFD